MGLSINPLRQDQMLNEKVNIQEDQLEDMQNDIKYLFNVLMVDTEKFNPERAFNILRKYICSYKRILYSTISNIMFDCNRNMQGKQQIGTILSNLETLLLFVNDDRINGMKNNADTEEEKKAINDTQKAVWKIWDHVNLANQQYLILWQSEDEYDKRFKTRIQKFQGKITGEMSGQLLSMVGIFTALAFLIFGSISSLESIFAAMAKTPVLKLMISGCAWGIGLLNTIFIFLFCVGKMTNQDFKSDKSPEATFYQRYPVVCWTNFIAMALLAIFMWMYYLSYSDADSWLNDVINVNPTLISIIGFGIIGIILWTVGKKLIEKTKQRIGDEDTYQ